VRRFVITLILMSSNLIAEDGTVIAPRSSPTALARADYEQAMKNAEHEYKNKIEGLRKTFAEKLSAILKDTMVAGDLEEANRIDVERKAIIAEMQADAKQDAKPIAPPAKCTEITVEALIDGHTLLMVDPNGIYWRNLDVGKVSQCQIQGKDVALKWSQPEKTPGRTEYLPFTLVKGKLTAELVAIGQNRGGNAIEPRDPITVWSESDTLFVWIPDSQAGARWYRFRLKSEPVNK
jgi:hypothetical protein